MAKERGSVRIGPVSIFALVIMLCLAVLAVLSVTTANAGWALAQRQASFTADLYLNEQAGQQFLVNVDEQLASVRSGKTSTKQAMGQLKDSVQKLADEAQVGGTASVTGARTIAAQFTSAKGHMLLIKLDVRDDGTYQITNWQTTTADAEEVDDLKLWSGTST